MIGSDPQFVLLNLFRNDITSEFPLQSYVQSKIILLALYQLFFGLTDETSGWLPFLLSVNESPLESLKCENLMTRFVHKTFIRRKLMTH